MNNKTVVEKSGLSAAEVSRLLNRAKYGRRVSWRQAYMLSAAYGRSIGWWRRATDKQIQKIIGG